MGWPRTTSSFPEPTWWNGDSPPSEVEEEEDTEPEPEESDDECP